MNLQDLKEKLVAVLGYGVEGKAVAAYLIKHGLKPVLFDQKPWAGWPADEQQKIRDLGLHFIFGPDCFKELAGFDVVFRSPGIKIADVAQALGLPYKQGMALRYKDKGPIITSQTKWFIEHCPAKIIGVTGTKGKGTTATLIYEILNRSVPIYRRMGTPINGHATPEKIFLTGNIGKTQPLEILDDLKPDDWVVYELSSFQLQDLTQSPQIAVVLMVTGEHLDYHKDIAEYVAAKSAITKFQSPTDVAIINKDYPNSQKIGEQGSGKKIYFKRGDKFPFDVSKRQLKGEHNLENIWAAVSAGRAAGIADDAIQQAVISFKGLEHRLEFVAEKHGVKFYNDSFSTTPETAIAAIKSFNEPGIVILGGSPKNADFSDLGRTIADSKNIKALILIGEEAARIKSAINQPLPASPFAKGRGNAEPPSFSKEGVGGVNIMEGAKNMQEIFAQIKSIAKPGDVVLLSPACASFDMFKNYSERGEQFKQAVNSF